MLYVQAHVCVAIVLLCMMQKLFFMHIKCFIARLWKLPTITISILYVLFHDNALKFILYDNF